MFLLAVCTSVFYGVLLWALYIAVEPFVRRYWPQVLVSLTNVLTGRARDPVVGRDVLIGAALGVAWVLMIRSVDLLSAGSGEGFVDFTGDMDLLAGLRSTAGAVLRGVPYAIRNVLFYFFLLFLLRVFLRREWAAALAFAASFGLLSALSNDDDRWLSAGLTLLYFGSGAFVVLRWGLLAFAVAAFMTELLMDVPATLDSSAWFFGNMLLLMAIAAGLAAWALYASVTRARPSVRKLDVRYQ
jgi:serine/threonine-protein kinase